MRIRTSLVAVLAATSLVAGLSQLGEAAATWWWHTQPAGNGIAELTRRGDHDQGRRGRSTDAELVPGEGHRRSEDGDELHRRPDRQRRRQPGDHRDQRPDHGGHRDRAGTAYVKLPRRCSYSMIAIGRRRGVAALAKEQVHQDRPANDQRFSEYRRPSPTSRTTSSRPGIPPALTKGETRTDQRHAGPSRHPASPEQRSEVATDGEPRPAADRSPGRCKGTIDFSNFNSAPKRCKAPPASRGTSTTQACS